MVGARLSLSLYFVQEGNMAVTPVEDDGGHLLLGITYLQISWLKKDSNKDFIHSAPTAHIYKVKVRKLGLLFKRHKSTNMGMFAIEKSLLLHAKFMIRWNNHKELI